MRQFSHTRQLHVLVLVIMTTLSVSRGSAQNSDSTYIAMLSSELSLTPVQLTMIDSIYQLSSKEISSTEKEIQSVSRRNLTQEEKDRHIADLVQKKKTLKETRELNIVLLLTPDQKKIYDEQIRPQKPSVLHMGMNHDRANCNICLPK
jgi:hypothetical protein